MIGDIAAVVGRARGIVSVGLLRGRRRHAVGLAVVVLLVGLSGYMAAGDVTVEFGADEDVESVEGGAAAIGAESGRLPPGVVTDRPDADRPDADGDGLADRAERETYGTDPTDPDTDGDGIGDGAEVACSAAYPGADPLRQDVYVEVDAVEGAGLSTTSADALRAIFADAPVENPGGEDGIALHLVRSDEGLPEGDSVNDDPREGAYNDVADYREAHFQHSAAGYHYLLVSTDVAYGGDDYYAGAGEPGTAIVEAYDRDGVMTSLVLHELGHAFGIDAGTDGVDERTYSRAEYTSVMNYNALYEVRSYSDGTDDVGRDEWGHVANDRHRPTIETPEDGLCPAIGEGTATAGDRG